MSETYHPIEIDHKNNTESEPSDNLDITARGDLNTTASAVVKATGGAGGSGGAGGQGGYAFNITYVDNYSILLIISTFLPLFTNNDDKISKDSLSLLKSIVEEQKEYRQEFLEVIRSLKQ